MCAPPQNKILQNLKKNNIFSSTLCNFLLKQNYMDNQINKSSFVLLLLLALLSCLNLQAQTDKSPAFSVRVRKSVECNDMSVVSVPIVVSEAVETRPPMVDSIVSYPRLWGGDLGLMPIRTYSSEAQKKDKKYVVFEVTVDKTGKATNIIYHDTNNEELVSVLHGKLRQSRWHPARTASGKNIAYKYPLQVISLPINYESREKYDE
jgi:hypothetical protein